MDSVNPNRRLVEVTVQVRLNKPACRDELRTTCRVPGAKVNDESIPNKTRAVAVFPASLYKQADHKQAGRCNCRRCKIQRDMERKDYMLDMAGGRVLNNDQGIEEFHVPVSKMFSRSHEQLLRPAVKVSGKVLLFMQHIRTVVQRDGPNHLELRSQSTSGPGPTSSRPGCRGRSSRTS